MERAHGLVVVGAGAAGLMAAIQAGRQGAPALVLDGARTLGAKILVAGGGRCNVTHDFVDETSFAGASPNAIRKVLRRFDAERTVRFFRELGVELKREETGKLFPVTDRARTVLDALLRAAADAGATVRHPARVTAIRREGEQWVVSGDGFEIRAARLVLATGGMSLPKSGSDGGGLQLAKALGHTLTPRLLPALVGLTLADGCFLRDLSGLTLEATFEVRAKSGKRLATRTASTLCTHFGISGPAPMDISRHWQHAHFDDAQAKLVVNWIPGETREGLDATLRAMGGTTVLRALSARLPTSLVRAICAHAKVDPATTGHHVTREQRRALTEAVVELPLPVTGTRGWNQAEATAGGVPLPEVRLETMESRLAEGLHLCGEMLDVDGRIGGYNFQWAWSSGYVAGTSAAAALAR